MTMDGEANDSATKDGIVGFSTTQAPVIPQPKQPINSLPPVDPSPIPSRRKSRQKRLSPEIKIQAQQIINGWTPKHEFLRKRLDNLDKESSNSIAKQTLKSRDLQQSSLISSPSISNRRHLSSSSMSSARRQPRSGARSGPHDGGEETQVWRHIHSQLQQLRDAESRAKVLRDSIIDLESKMKTKLVAGEKPPEEDFDSLDSLYREQVKIAEEQKLFLAENLPGMEEKIGLLGAIVRGNEDESGNPPGGGRTGSSRSSALDFEGPSDSPGPSAENKHVRKIANSRNGSLPPKSSETSARGDATPNDVPERVEKKPKIVFAVGEEVAFKRKIPGKLEEQDWIQGIVTRVIGEGKSRRYDVQDPFPEGAATKPGEFTYKSSASQMVPIPAPGTPLNDYEVGRAVLALYPETTTFYRAEVKAMLDNGASVQLLFEDEAAGALKVVERRMVLDHKG